MPVGSPHAILTILPLPMIVMLTSTDVALIKLLADGRFHSGTDLGHTLGISRAAVWQRLKRLQAQGLRLRATPGRGYRLSQPLDLLDPERILSQLPERYCEQLQCLEVWPQLASTNQYLRDQQAQLNGVRVVLAESQTAGRGRAGRAWSSPFAANIYLSLAVAFEHGGAQLSSLSLALAVAVVDTLQAHGITGAGIKWPNDILVDGKKIAGILVEISGQLHAQAEVIIGVGLNVCMPDDISLDQPWTDIASEGGTVCRNQVAASLIGGLLSVCASYRAGDTQPWVARWRELDLSYDRPLRLLLNDQVIVGIGKGVDPQGMLLVEHDGELKRYASGDVSLRIAHG